MTWRSDSASLVSGAWVSSAYPGHGILGVNIPADGVNGPSFLYNDYDAPGDNAKEFRGLILTTPASGAFVADEDGSFTLTGAADGTYTFTYRLFVDGVDLGTATGTIVIGREGAGAITLGAFTTAAAGFVGTRSGAGAVTLSAFTVAGAGTVLAGRVGVGALTLGSFAAAGAGSVTGPSGILGASSLTLGAFAAAGTGTVMSARLGAGAVTLAAFTSSASGTVLGGVTGAAAVVLGSFGMAATGAAAVNGQGAMSLAGFLAAGAGLVVTMEPIEGVGDVVMGSFVTAGYGGTSSFKPSKSRTFMVSVNNGLVQEE